MKRVERNIQRLAYVLLFHAYLDSRSQAPPTAKASWAAVMPQTAEARGNALVTTLTEASEHDGSAEASLLLGMNAQFRLDQAIASALDQVLLIRPHGSVLPHR